ncbi:MAG: endo-1,4-beta-xylanase, partial [Propionibacteriaceae bacterium]|nr:endo-1,4-beta-xylanase [Propionibacteriaceae bacterium]
MKMRGDAGMIHRRRIGRGVAVAATASLVTAMMTVGTLTSIVHADPVGPPVQVAGLSTGFENGYQLNLNDDNNAHMNVWGNEDGGNQRVTVAVVQGGAHSGNAAACVSNRVSNQSGLAINTQDLVPGTLYSFSAWMKFTGNEDPGTTVALTAYVPGASDEFPYFGRSMQVGANWTQISSQFVAPVVGTYAHIFFSTEGQNDKLSDYCVDDISFMAQDRAADLALTPLKDTMGGVPVGAAVCDDGQLFGATKDLLTTNFSQVTPCNAMKVSSWYDGNGNFRASPGALSLMTFAQQNNMRVYGHNLVWHESNPDWWFDVSAADPTPLIDPATNQPIAQAAAIMTQRLHDHIFDVAQALSAAPYGLFGSASNPLVAFDVVNEALDLWNPAGGLYQYEWSAILGTDPKTGYIALAFQDADQAFNHVYAQPGVDRPIKLFINEYGTETGFATYSAVASKELHNTVSDLVNAGIPIDGIGHQFHDRIANLTTDAQNNPIGLQDNPIPAQNLEDNLNYFNDIPGIVQAVTEFDVDLAPNAAMNGGVVPDAALQEQGQYYKDAFAGFRDFAQANPGKLFSVTTWGVNDNTSPGDSAQAVSALLFDANLSAKPAYLGAVGDAAPPNPVAPDAPVITSPVDQSSVEGSPVTVSGTAVAGGDVSVSDGAAVACTTVAAADGSWSCDADLAVGDHILTAIQSVDGQDSVASDVVKVTVTVAPPVPPVVPDAPVITSPVDKASVETSLVTVSGTGVAGDTVTVHDGDAMACTTVVAADGSWSCDAELTVGDHSLTAIQSVDGLDSDPSAAVSVSVTGAPNPTEPTPTSPTTEPTPTSPTTGPTPTNPATGPTPSTPTPTSPTTEPTPTSPTTGPTPTNPATGPTPSTPTPTSPTTEPTPTSPTTEPTPTSPTPGPTPTNPTTGPTPSTPTPTGPTSEPTPTSPTTEPTPTSPTPGPTPTNPTTGPTPTNPTTGPIPSTPTPTSPTTEPTPTNPTTGPTPSTPTPTSPTTEPTPTNP